MAIVPASAGLAAIYGKFAFACSLWRRGDVYLHHRIVDRFCGSAFCAGAMQISIGLAHFAWEQCQFTSAGRILRWSDVDLRWASANCNGVMQKCNEPVHFASPWRNLHWPGAKLHCPGAICIDLLQIYIALAQFALAWRKITSPRCNLQRPGAFCIASSQFALPWRNLQQAGANCIMTM